MPNTEHDQIVADWIAATNSHNARKYLSYFAPEAAIDDPSVGETFERHEGIGRYYRSYFIDFNTSTRLVRTEPRGEVLHVEVDFTGDFPGGQTGGIFDITFSGRKIAGVAADLL